jgi:hypothetical protein
MDLGQRNKYSRMVLAQMTRSSSTKKQHKFEYMGLLPVQNVNIDMALAQKQTSDYGFKNGFRAELPTLEMVISQKNRNSSIETG